MPTDFIGLFGILAGTRIRFVVVGGLALVLDGLDRLAADLDLVIDQAAERVRDAVGALRVAGYRPLAPVDPMARADPAQRHEWQTTRSMQVFSFWDSTNSRSTIDVMLSSAIPPEDPWSRAVVTSIGGHEVRVAGVKHLIRMKEAAGRRQELADAERLRARLEG